jgi:AcrR family transcriptional regulator
VVETTRRREIEAAASTLFHERGYSGTSVRDIARALDIQGASLYAHVTSKEEVLWSIVERTATRFETAADAATVGVDPADAAGRLDALVRAHVGVVTEDVERASVFVHEWRSLASARRASISRRRDAYEARFRSVIELGAASADFGPVDPTTAAAFILTALNGLVAWYRPNGRLRPAEVAGIYAELALGAVGGGAHAPHDGASR